MKWYKMDCDAQENLDMRKMVDEWGWDWYGRYWAILGKIGMLVTEKCQSFALQTNDGRPFPVKLLANDLGTTEQRLNEFCKFLSDNCLIDKSAWTKKGLIYAPKLKERADEYTDKLGRKSRQTPAQEEEVEGEIDKKKNSYGRPTIDEVNTLWKERNYPSSESLRFWNYYESNGWRVGKNPMKDWRAAAAGWVTRSKDYSPQQSAPVERTPVSRICEKCRRPFTGDVLCPICYPKNPTKMPADLEKSLDALANKMKM